MARATVDLTPKPVQTYILLDKSGSMSKNWLETIGAMNAYVVELAAEPTSAGSKVTLAAFDQSVGAMDFAVLRQGVQAREWVTVSERETTPRGYTPLYDAIGRIVAMAEADAPEKAVFVVITDGAENASREFTKPTAKAALDRCRDRGWQVVFIGADFDAMAQSQGVGGSVGQTLSMNAGNYAAATQSLARKTRSYGLWAGSGASGQSISFSAEDRAEAAGTNVRIGPANATKETGV